MPRALLTVLGVLILAGLIVVVSLPVPAPQVKEDPDERMRVENGMLQEAMQAANSAALRKWFSANGGVEIVDTREPMRTAHRGGIIHGEQITRTEVDHPTVVMWPGPCYGTGGVRHLKDQLQELQRLIEVRDALWTSSR